MDLNLFYSHFVRLLGFSVCMFKCKSLEQVLSAQSLCKPVKALQLWTRCPGGLKKELFLLAVSRGETAGSEKKEALELIGEAVNER